MWATGPVIWLSVVSCRLSVKVKGPTRPESGRMRHPAMKVHGIGAILTFNVKDFNRYDGVTAMHPDSVG